MMARSGNRTITLILKDDDNGLTSARLRMTVSAAGVLGSFVKRKSPG